MAKWIKETFPLEMPDYPMSHERTKGHVADWTYEGPRRVAVYVYKDTNLLAWNHSYQNLSDKKDPDFQKEQWEFLEIHAGLYKYPVELTFEKDSLLLAAFVQSSVLEEEVPLQKELHCKTNCQAHRRRDVDGDGGAYVPNLSKQKTNPSVSQRGQSSTDKQIASQTKVHCKNNCKARRRERGGGTAGHASRTSPKTAQLISREA